MKRLPPLPPRAVIAALRKAGFKLNRAESSIRYYRHRSARWRTTAVPMLGVLAPATIRLILQLALSREEFLDLLPQGRGRIVTKPPRLAP